MKVLALSGSLRHDSYNTALLKEALMLAPEGMEIEIVVPSDIPLYNMDIEREGLPESVVRLKEKIRAADGILIMSPEHNHSVPGVLKNTLDWVSREGNDFSDKPLAIGGASDGIISTARMQTHLLAIANTLNMHTMSRPLFQVPNVDKKFEDGKLIDEKTREKLQTFLLSFKKWIERLS